MKLKRLNLLVAIALLLAACLSAAAAQETPPSDVHFYFVQLTDTHADNPDNLARLERAVRAINELPVPIECVVHTGDIMEDDILDKALTLRMLEAMRPLPVPVHYLPGNHDVLLDDYLPTRDAFRTVFGPLATKAEHRGVVFLMLYIEGIARSVSLPEYDPLPWLEQQLDESAGRPVLIFIHTPPVEDFYASTFHSGWPAEARARFEALVTSHNVRAVIAGHFHRDEQHWIGSVPLHVCPPVSNHFGRELCFRLYEYNNGQISYRTRYPK